MALTAEQLVRLSLRRRPRWSGKTGSRVETGVAVDEHLAEHVPRVYRFALSLTGDVHHAEDITQETFVRAWKRRRKLRNGDESTRVWLFRTAHNLWRDHLRKAMRRDKSLDDGFVDPSATASAPPCEVRDDATLVLAAMASLPVRQREVLHLAACEQLSIPAIAAVLGITREAAKASLSLARRGVRERLSSDA